MHRKISYGMKRLMKKGFLLSNKCIFIWLYQNKESSILVDDIYSSIFARKEFILNVKSQLNYFRNPTYFIYLTRQHWQHPRLSSNCVHIRYAYCIHKWIKEISCFCSFISIQFIFILGYIVVILKRIIYNFIKIFFWSKSLFLI